MKAASIRILSSIVGTALIFTLSSCGQDSSAPSSPSSEELSSDSQSLSSQEDKQKSVTSVDETSISENAVSSNQLENSSENSQVSSVSPSVSDSSLDVGKDGTSTVPPLSNIASIYARNPSGHTYVGAWADFENQNPSEFEIEMRKCLALFEGLEPAGEEQQITDNEFLIWTEDGVRHTYGVARGGYLIADGKTYLLPQDRVLPIQLAHDYLCHTNTYIDAYPQWLVWMTPSKINKIIFYSPTHGPMTITSDLDLIKHAALNATPAVEATGDSTYKLGSIDFSGSDVFHLEIRFDTGIVYHIHAINSGYEADYYVESSDMSFGCKYHLKMASVEGPANNLINYFEYMANAKSIKDMENPTT